LRIARKSCLEIHAGSNGGQREVEVEHHKAHQQEVGVAPEIKFFICKT
jgi:hypothetical protein